jgi:hypothetical protein
MRLHLEYNSQKKLLPLPLENMKAQVLFPAQKSKQLAMLVPISGFDMVEAIVN